MRRLIPLERKLQSDCSKNIDKNTHTKTLGHGGTNTSTEEAVSSAARATEGRISHEKGSNIRR